MNRHTKPAEQEPRSSQLDRHFPQGVPGLWAALITHYTSEGQIDWPRMHAHVEFVRAHVKGVVLASRQGDGSSLDAETRTQLMTWADKTFKVRREFFMIAMDPAKADAAALLQAVQTHCDGISPDAPSSFTGLWVHATCANGSADSTSESLDALLASGLPLGLEADSLDQQATSTQGIASFAQQYENILYAGDASRDDQLARSSELPAGVFRLRTAEGDYSKQLGSTGGPYHGLLLASANHFPKQLDELVLAPALGKWDEAHASSAKLTDFYKDAIALQGQTAPQLCKAIDHHMAHGLSATDAPPPFMHDRKPLPTALIQSVGELLTRHNLLPETGYLE